MMEKPITIDKICARYGCERHRAAAIMRQLPRFKPAKKWIAYERDLEEWERGQMIYPLPKGGRKPKETLYAIPRRKAE